MPLCLTAALLAWQAKPSLSTNVPDLDRAFSIAVADTLGNVKPYREGILERTSPVLMAGAGYGTPWTRDSAINTWNGVGLLWPDIARNTLLSVMERKDGNLRIGGQYWDAILWSTGAWQYYLFTGDRDLLAKAYDATKNTLALREADEFDSKTGLFRGPAVYGDGVAAYPDRYGSENRNSSSILDWPRNNPTKASKPGFGLPMATLSTNCAYYNAYRLLPAMAKSLGQAADPVWVKKAKDLRTAIDRAFWKPDLGRYITLVDPWGEDDRQEALGLAFSVLFDVADASKRDAVFANAVLTPQGMPCLWPTYERYASLGGFGRHSGTVWPHGQAFWADAAARGGHADLFAYELMRLTANALRDRQFTEIYHPITGQPYGGLQEGGPIRVWDSQPHQTWSATGYLRMILFDLAGMRFDERGLTFTPTLPGGVRDMELKAIAYRKATLDIRLHGQGSRIAAAMLNGKRTKDIRILSTAKGAQVVEIWLAERKSGE